MPGSILIVDQSSTSRILLKVRLTAACYHVVTAHGLDEALDHLQGGQVQAVIMSGPCADLPEVAVCARLVAETGGRVPVVALTSGAGRIAALRAGAAAVVEKPVDDMILLARIRGLLRDTPVHDPLVDLAALTPADLGVPGFAEGQASFGVPGRTAPGVVALVAESAGQAMGWRRALQDKLAAGLRIVEAERVLTEAAAGRGADLYVIASDLARTGDGLVLLSELRARPDSRDSAICLVVPANRPELMAVGLDLGAADVIDPMLLTASGADEVALRLTAQMRRKRANDRRKDAAARSQQLALTDALTGLPNRRYAMARLGETAQRSAVGDVLSLIVLDIDMFKRINDFHGHAAGDAVLSAVAGLLQSALPKGAFLARMGGEEFLAILPGESMASALGLADAARAAVSRAPVALPDVAGGGAIHVTLSAGIATSRGAISAAGVERLMAQADHAMLDAKARGRNRSCAASMDAAA